MYVINLNEDLTIDAVSVDFKAIMKDKKSSLKGCFFISMMDCTVPDQLATDLSDSIDHGLVYNISLKINVINHPRWFDVSITPRYHNGHKIGYKATLQETSDQDIEVTARVYAKVEKGEMLIKQGWPVQNTQSVQDNLTTRWDSRIA